MKTKKGTAQFGCSCRIETVLSVDQRGQMVLPKELRRKAGIGAGDKLALVSWESQGEVCCLCLVKAEALTGMVRELLGPTLQALAPEGKK